MSAIPVLEKRLLTTDDYHALIAAGILDEDDKVELLNGELIFKSPIGPRHGSVVGRIDALLQQLLHNSAIVFVQNPVSLSPSSEPEPDLAIVKPRDDFYAESHPSPEDVFLLIEVADATLDKDRTVKAALYAEAGILYYWIVNLPEQQLEVYAQPGKGQYKLRQICLLDEKVVIEPFGIEVGVEQLLGSS